MMINEFKKDKNQMLTEQFVSKYLANEANLIDTTAEPNLLPPQPIPNKLPKNLLPDFLFELQASNLFLCLRVINLPESEVYGTHYNEIDMLRRLNNYRHNQLGPNANDLPILEIPGKISFTNENENTSLNHLALASVNENSVRAFFDSKNIVQIPINIMNDQSNVSAN